MTIQNKRVLEEKDPVKRRERLEEMRSTTADPAKARDFLLRTSMFEGLKSASHIALLSVVTPYPLNFVGRGEPERTAAIEV